MKRVNILRQLRALSPKDRIAFVKLAKTLKPEGFSLDEVYFYALHGGIIRSRNVDTHTS
jgi:hypothetical protein